MNDANLFEDSADYRAFTLTADENGIRRTAFREWVASADSESRIELRAPSAIRPSSILEHWRYLGVEPSIVSSVREFLAYLRSGGCGLVRLDIVEQVAPKWLEPAPMVESAGLGFRAVETPIMSAVKRNPSKKLRMRVLKRDGHRCRSCGAIPITNPHVELHLHHVRPWSERGITDEQNLITLCKLCHDGLEPHFDQELRSWVEPLAETQRHDTDYREAIARGVDRYRRVIAALQDASET